MQSIIVKQKRVVDNKDGTKTLQERVIEKHEQPDNDGNSSFTWEWEDICVLSPDMLKDKSLVLTCLTKWLAKEA